MRGTMRKRVIQRLKWLAFECSTEYSEIASSLLLGGWAIYLLNPSRALSASRSVSTTLSDSGIPSEVWGWGLLILAVLQCMSAVFGLVRIRSVVAFLLAPFWWFMGVLVLSFGGITPWILAYAGFAFLNSWCFIRLVGPRLRQTRLAMWLARRAIRNWGKSGSE